MMKKSYVYILTSKCLKKIKIGKADDVNKRIYTLQNSYEFDLDSSYTVQILEKDVFRLENALHFIFKGMNLKDLPKNDGYTEFFKIECLNDLLQTLEICSKYNDISFSKGIKYYKNDNAPILKGIALKDKLLKNKVQRIIKTNYQLETLLRYLARCYNSNKFTWNKKSKYKWEITFTSKKKYSDIEKFRNFRYIHLEKNIDYNKQSGKHSIRISPNYKIIGNNLNWLYIFEIDFNFLEDINDFGNNYINTLKENGIPLFKVLQEVDIIKNIKEYNEL